MNKNTLLIAETVGFIAVALILIWARNAGHISSVVMYVVLGAMVVGSFFVSSRVGRRTSADEDHHQTRTSRR
ncbi:MAG: hypothetical protein Q4G34_05985 [Micrococcus sp.]|nr:hypothetical protein [Micrococcus sp.]